MSGDFLNGFSNVLSAVFGGKNGPLAMGIAGILTLVITREIVGNGYALSGKNMAIQPSEASKLFAIDESAKK